MKLGMSLAGIESSLRNLNEVGIIIEKDFKSELVEQGKKLKERAKQILEEKSQQETGKKYWTGKLQEAIKLYVGEETSYGYETGSEFKSEERKALNISVGPDMRIAPYAEWVEIGHYKAVGDWGAQRGGWWEGYHYLEGAWVEIAPSISTKIAETIRIALNNFERTANQRTKHSKTKQFTKGFAGMKGEGA